MIILMTMTNLMVLNKKNWPSGQFLVTYNAVAEFPIV
ncbi:hypothetical protein IMSAGC002_01108 [Lachnospiraceae bacterium]|jgi:hypothetical protein|nr:hypothetical protein IMSAGC002_01108 [Lachnospiraceae bacterium]